MIFIDEVVVGMESRATILLVEDEVELAKWVASELKFEGYQVKAVYDGSQAVHAAQASEYDLILLDLNLPQIGGMEVLRRLRTFNDRPVIILTARDDLTDKIVGLDAGANDYITKPFEIRELLARIRAALRSHNRSEACPDVLRVADVEVHLASRQVTAGEDRIELTPTEFELLAYLMQNKGLVLSRDQIVARVWGYEYMGESNSVDVHIRNLRNKLNHNQDRRVITTVRGVGYAVRGNG